MSTTRKFKFEINKNKDGKYKIKNSLTGGTIRATFNTIEEAQEEIKSRVERTKDAQRKSKS